jgi:hypothetical protein
MTIRIGGLIAAGTTTVGGESTVLQIWGLWHLVGLTVSVYVDGQDTGDYTVAADGSVSINITVAGDAGYNITAATLVADDGGNVSAYGESTTPITITHSSASSVIYIAIVVGQPFVAQGQRLRAATQDNIKGAKGAALGRRRRSSQFAVLVQDGVIVSFGTTLLPSPGGNMIQAVFPTADGITPIAASTQFSGVYWNTLNDDYTFDGGLCWQIDRPWTCTICAVSQFMVTEEAV